MRGSWAAVVVAAVIAIPSAARAQGQDLGHRLLGGVGLDAGTQPDEGVYLTERFLRFGSERLVDRHGETVPIDGLVMRAVANVVGLSGIIELERGGYLGAAVAVTYVRYGLSAEEPSIDITRLGLDDMFAEPIRIGWRLPRVDVVSSYGLYMPVFQRKREGLARPQWAHGFSAGGTLFFDDDRGWRVSALATYLHNRPKIGIDITRGDTVQVQGGVGGRAFGVLDFGVAAYALWQLFDDTGTDLPPMLRGLRERTFGLGPEIDLVIPALRARLTLRYTRDLGVRSRPDGSVFIVNLSFAVWKPQPPPRAPGARTAGDRKPRRSDRRRRPSRTRRRCVERRHGERERRADIEPAVRRRDRRRRAGRALGGARARSRAQARAAV